MSHNNFDPAFLDTPGSQDMPPETMKWSGRPALRPEIWYVVIAAFLVWLALRLLDALMASLPAEIAGAFGPDKLPITPAAILIWGAVGLGIWRILVRLTTRYDLSDRNLYVRRGVLNRVHQQLELHRVRDVEVMEPLQLRVLGLGRVVVHSVDRTNPRTILAAQGDAPDLSQALYQLVKAEQDRVGYREFEGTASL
mgnify:FL=1